MKKYLLLILLIPSLCYSQNKKKLKGYANVGGSEFISNKFGNQFGISANAGLSPSDYFCAGLGLDFFELQDKRPKFLQGYVDFKFFMAGLTKTVSPFLAVQPGLIFYHHATETLPLLGDQKGSFAINLIAGVQVKPKKGIGGYLSFGYSNISFERYGARFKYGGARLSLGLAF